MKTSRRRFDSSPPNKSSTYQLVRLIGGLVLVLAFMYLAWQKSQEQPGPKRPPLGADRQVEIEVVQPEKGARKSVPDQPGSDIESTARRERKSDSESPRVRTADEPAVTTLLKNLKIRSQDGKVVYEGDIDLADTLDRIGRNERVGHGNDGSVFQNREKRLPQKASGYYHEWVHPTKGERGPGRQRIVTGKNGEIYYTPDHYETFRRLDGMRDEG